MINVCNKKKKKKITLGEQRVSPPRGVLRVTLNDTQICIIYKLYQLIFKITTEPFGLDSLVTSYLGELLVLCVLCI